MRALLLFLSLFILTGCKDTPSASRVPAVRIGGGLEQFYTGHNNLERITTTIFELFKPSN